MVRVDAEGNVLDQVNWSASSSVNALVERLSDLQSGRLSPEARVLANRFPEAVSNPLGAISDESWPELSKEESVMLSEASIELARKGVAASASNPDRRLDMLSGATSELRTAWGTSESRCVEWAGLFITEADLEIQRSEIPKAIADSTRITESSEKLGVSPPKHEPSELEWNSMRSQAQFVVDTSSMLNQQEDAIREMASSHVPSLSALLGPISAAKLVVLAGGRERLARMPSGSLQVLGAHAAMSAHRRGAPPPKHGAVLFSMPQISRSPRWVRGKIARFLAGKASIAVRVDHFEGDPWSKKQVDEINKEINVIREKFPRPPKR